METALNTKATSRVAKKQTAKAPDQAPKRLSKLGQWMREHPGGVFTVIDRRAVNK